MPDRQARSIENGILVKVGYRNFGRRYEKSIFPLQPVQVRFKLWQLARAGHGFAVDDSRYPDLIIAMPVNMQVHHELQKSALHSCRRSPEHGKPAPGQRCTSLEIKNAQGCADIPVRRHLILPRIPPTTEFDIVFLTLAIRHGFMQGIGNFKQNICKAGFGLFCLCLKHFYLPGYFAHGGNFDAGIFATALFLPDQLGNPVALRLQRFGFIF